MGLDRIHSFEKAVVTLLNFDDWNLKWTGEGYDSCDAVGETPKGITCAMEMKFRTTWYETKMLEVYKYERLMDMDVEARFYFVNDPKGHYIFWLDDIELPEKETMYCPDTTLWTKKKKDKEVYLLQESLASYTISY